MAETPSLAGRKTGVGSRKDQTDPTNGVCWWEEKPTLGNILGNSPPLPHILYLAFPTHKILRIHLNYSLNFVLFLAVH